MVKFVRVDEAIRVIEKLNPDTRCKLEWFVNRIKSNIDKKELIDRDIDTYNIVSGVRDVDGGRVVGYIYNDCVVDVNCRACWYCSRVEEPIRMDFLRISVNLSEESYDPIKKI